MASGGPAMDFWKQLMTGGTQGAEALSGDSNATAKFMNPYLSAMNPVFDKMRAQAGMASDANATQQGAFGGTRADVQRGAEMGQIDNSQAGFNYQGFNDAMQRALQSANLGFGGWNTMQQLGNRPTGGQTSVPTQHSPIGQILGIMGMLGGLPFGPGGSAVGGALGKGLGGLFGGGGGGSGLDWSQLASLGGGG